MQNPLISIVIPCHNQGQFLPQTLDSVLSQTYTNWECILVNDGSEDNTELVSHNYCGKDSRFKYIFQEKQGVSSARNAGSKIGKGNYFQFLDSDDLLASNKLELQIIQLRQFDFNPNIISFTRHLYFYNNDITQIDIEKSTDIRLCRDYFIPMELLIDSWRYLDGFTPNSWLFHRELVQQAGPWDESLPKNQDGEYFSRILPLAEKLIFCNNTNVYYRCNMKSTCNTMDETKLMSQLKAVRLITTRIKNYRVDKEINEIIYKMYMFYMYPSQTNKIYLSEFKKDLKELGYNFDIVNRGRYYRILYFVFGKIIADKLYLIKNQFLNK